MSGDWQQLIQSVFIGLIFSFLLAKLISFVTAFKEDNLFLSRASNDLPRTNQREPPGSTARYDESGLGLPKVGSVNSLGDYNDVASRVSDDNSVLAEKGSIAGLDSILGDVSDDDWEGLESTELDEAFSAATSFMAASAVDKLVHKVPNDVQLMLYGLYKIGTEGPCTASPPPAFKMTARAKWQAWQKLGAMLPEDAMQKYVEIVTELFPSWASGAAYKNRGADADLHGSESRGPMGPVFSTFALKEQSGADTEGRTPLHWAVDYGHLSDRELLVNRNADVNVKDNEGHRKIPWETECRC
ncbi:hypothetical protein Ancab_009045 [Ancistrocladus abbreviatus]